MALIRIRDVVNGNQEDDVAANDDRVIAVGLLTQSDLDRLGQGFRRIFPIPDAGDFDDLIQALDQISRPGAAPRSASRPAARE